MYNVSDAYLSALKNPYRVDKISGMIRLSDNTRIILSDENTIQNKLTITKKACGTTFSVGNFNSAQLTLGIFDDSAGSTNYSGAVVYLEYSLLTAYDNATGQETWEDIPLGYFYIDGQETTRRGNQVTLHGYDAAYKFDVNLPSHIDEITTMWDALVAACLKANVGLAVTEEQFSYYINATAPIDCTDKRIQSCRDLIMWIASATSSVAYINRNNFLELKPYEHSALEPDRVFNDREIGKIEFSDTLTYLAYLVAYQNGEPKAYSNVVEWVDEPHIKEGALNLKENPLFIKQTEEEQETANLSLLYDGRISPLGYSKADVISDAAIDLYDTIVFSSALIDNDRNAVDGVVTEIKWKYRGKGTITCRNVDEYAPSADDGTDAYSVMALSEDGGDSDGDTSEQSETEEVMRRPPKDQLEKRVDAIEGKLREGGTGGDTIENAIIIEENSVRHLIHSYTTVGYFHGNKLVYGGAKNPVIVNGAEFHAASMASPYMQYGKLSFQRGTTSGNSTVEPKLISWRVKLYNDETRYYTLETFINDEGLGTFTSLSPKMGFYCTYSQIHAPESDPNNFPYGFVACKVYRIYTNTSGTIVTNNAFPIIKIGFESIAEYEYAVGLTTEPVFGETIEETVTTE